MVRWTWSPPTRPPPYVRRKTRTDFCSAEGEGEINLRGYWNVIFESAETPNGSNWTLSCPLPGDDDDGGNGEFMVYE
jgi:hypothetical protein